MLQISVTTYFINIFPGVHVKCLVIVVDQPHHKEDVSFLD